MKQYPWSAEKGVHMRNRILGSWDFGWKRAFPLWLEFVLIGHWRSDSRYWHERPYNLAFELPLEGDMSITIDGSPEIVRPGELLILPMGVENDLRVGPSGSCWKLSCGLCGAMTANLLSAFGLETGRILKLRDVSGIYTLLSGAARMLQEKDEKDAPKVAGAALELLTEIRLQSEIPDCHPELAGILRVMEFDLATPLDLGRIARSRGISREKLHLLFRKHLDASPGAYFRELRMKRAETLLRNSRTPIQAIARETGYTTVPGFIKEFRKKHGCTPGEFRRTKEQ